MSVAMHWYLTQQLARHTSDASVGLDCMLTESETNLYDNHKPDKVLTAGHSDATVSWVGLQNIWVRSGTSSDNTRPGSVHSRLTDGICIPTSHFPSCVFSPSMHTCNAVIWQALISKSTVTNTPTRFSVHVRLTAGSWPVKAHPQHPW